MFPWLKNEPTSGDSQNCIRVKNGKFKDVVCNVKHSGAVSKRTGMGVLCKHSGVDYVNKAKVGNMFYCDLEQIGLMEKVHGRFKETKYLLEDCHQKRSERPRAMLKKTAARLELNCVNCKKDNVVFSKVECQVKCKADRQSRLSASFGCEPVYDEHNVVVGSRYIFSEGFHRFKEICGSGCAVRDLHPYLGPELEPLSGRKCLNRDIHHRGSFASKQFCKFSCPSHHGNTYGWPTLQSTDLMCRCDTVHEDGRDKRQCQWRLKKGLRDFDATNHRGDYFDCVLNGCIKQWQCKDSQYVTPTTTTTTTTETTSSSTSIIPTSTKATNTTTTTTTTTSTSTNISEHAAVIVLNGQPYGGMKPVIFIDSSEKQSEMSCFQTDSNSEAVHSCSVVWQSQLFIFGGSRHATQISRLEGTKLERVGSLGFRHVLGACSSISNEYILLCFDQWSTKKCSRSTGPLSQFSRITDSNYDHRHTQTSASESK